MVSDRLKNELSELRTKILDIREFTAFSPEHFQSVCESLKNLQSVMVEMFHHEEAHRQPHSPPEPPVSDAVVGENQVAAA